MTAQTKRGNDYSAANRYLSDAARFGETHDPEALARQVPKPMKQVRLGTVEADKADSPAPADKTE